MLIVAAIVIAGANYVSALDQEKIMISFNLNPGDQNINNGHYDEISLRGAGGGRIGGARIGGSRGSVKAPAKIPPKTNPAKAPLKSNPANSADVNVKNGNTEVAKPRSNIADEGSVGSAVNSRQRIYGNYGRGPLSHDYSYGRRFDGSSQTSNSFFSPWSWYYPYMFYNMGSHSHNNFATNRSYNASGT